MSQTSAMFARPLTVTARACRLQSRLPPHAVHGTSRMYPSAPGSRDPVALRRLDGWRLRATGVTPS